MIAGARAALADHLRTETGLDVLPYLGSVDNVGKPLVLVGIATTKPDDTGTAELVTMPVWIVAAQTEPGPADDELDTAHDLVVAALLTMKATTWTAGQRGVYGDSQPAYELTVECVT